MSVPSLPRRFWEKVDKSAGLDGCWLWTGTKTAKGYGQIGVGGRAGGMRYAHRVVLELAGADLIPGMQVDHLCHVRGCVNPSHLRQVTPKQNVENRSGAQLGNASGLRGVNLHKPSGRWRARVRHHGRDIHLGYYDDPAEAAAVARAKRLELFSHSDMDRTR